MTKKEYGEYVKKRSPKSASGRNMLRAFLVGGLICCVGQALTDLYGALGLEKELSSTLTSVTLVFIGAALTGIGVYDKIAKFAGAGTLVPITGFANSVAAPAIEFRSEGIVTGTAVKMFTIAGPVIVFGVTASVIYGVILSLLR